MTVIAGAAGAAEMSGGALAAVGAAGLGPALLVGGLVVITVSLVGFGLKHLFTNEN